MKLSHAERVQGGLYGLLVGDAVGVPYEFHHPSDLPPRHSIDMVPPPGFARSYRHVPVGTWSDDGATALCLWASLHHCGRLDVDDLAQRLLAWLTTGYMSKDGMVFDVGITTRAALQRYRQGTPPLQAGGADEGDNGNGSLMRSLPLALWHTGSDAELVRDAMRQSCVTHAHLRAQVCCAVYCLWARFLLNEHPTPLPTALDRARQCMRRRASALVELRQIEQDLSEAKPTGSGYVVDSLVSAHWAMQQGSYADVIRAAISLGRDTDTTACIAGGLAGVRDGQTEIPSPWLLNLDEETVQNLAALPMENMIRSNS